MSPNSSSQPTALILVVHNLCAAVARALVRWPRNPAVAMCHAALLDVARDLRGLVDTRLGTGSNHLEGKKTEFPLWATWCVKGCTEQPGALDVLADLAWLLVHGETPSAGDLAALRQGLETAVNQGIAVPVGESFAGTEGSPLGREFDRAVARLSKRIAELAGLRNSPVLRQLHEQESGDYAIAATSGAESMLLASGPRAGAAAHLAANAPAYFRRQFSESSADALTGELAQCVVRWLRDALADSDTEAAAGLALCSMAFGVPVGQFVEEAILCDVVPDMQVPSEAEGRFIGIDLDRGLVAIGIPGRDRFWKGEGVDLAGFEPSRPLQILRVPPEVLGVLRRNVGDQRIGPAFGLDTDRLATQFIQLLQTMVREHRWPVSAKRLALALPAAVFQETDDLVLVQRLSAGDTGLGTSSQPYVSLPFALPAAAHWRALVNLGVVQAEDFRDLPDEWLDVRGGAFRLPKMDSMQRVADCLSAAIRPLFRAPRGSRSTLLLTPLAVNAVVLLLVGAGHRWEETVGELTKYNFELSRSLATFFDKPVDSGHSNRMVGLAPMVRNAVLHFREFLAWILQDDNLPASVAERAREALAGTKPLFFALDDHGEPTPMSLELLRTRLGSELVEFVRGGRCWLSSGLREDGVRAPVIEAELGHLSFGAQPHDESNGLAPEAFYAPALTCIDARLRGAGFRAFQGVPDRALVSAACAVPPPPWSDDYVKIEADIRRNHKVERKKFNEEAGAYAQVCEAHARTLVEKALSRQGTLDARAVLDILAALRKDLPRTPAAVVGAANALKKVCKSFVQRGAKIAPPKVYRPSFPQAPYVASGQLAAVGTFDCLKNWLLDPRSWPSPEASDQGSNRRRVARLAMLLLVEGAISDLRRASTVLAAIPAATRWAGLPDCLVCSVRWEGDRASAEPEAVEIGGASAMAALGVSKFLSQGAPSAKQLKQWISTSLKSSPWPVVDQEAMLDGLMRTVALARIFISPGPIAAISRGALNPREAPPDLLRALVEDCPAAPTLRPVGPDREGATPTRPRRLASSSVGRADRLRSLYERLESARKRNDPADVIDWANTKAGDDAEELLARIGARLIWLPGVRVAQYADGSQVTFLALVARRLLREFEGMDLSLIGAEGARAGLIRVWESGSPDKRRAVCLTVAAEVLEERFGLEDVAIDDISAASGLPGRPRALFPAPSTWARLAEQTDAACSLLESEQARREFLFHADLLDAQAEAAFRSGEVLFLRPKDICRAGDRVSLFVRPTSRRALKTSQSLRRCAVPLGSPGGKALCEFGETTERSLTALGDSVYFQSLELFTRSEVLQCLACDPRLRPHDLRSFHATTRVFDSIFCRDSEGVLELRSGPVDFWSLAAQLGHLHPRTTLQHYVHVLSLWQALLASVDAETLTVAQLESLTALPSRKIEAARRAAGGGRRRMGSLRGLRAQLLAYAGFSVAPPPASTVIAPPAVCSGATLSRSGRSEQLARAISLLCDGVAPGKVQQVLRVGRSELVRIAQSMAEFEGIFGCRFLPEESLSELLPGRDPAAADIHRSLRQACPARETFPLVPSRDVAEHSLRLMWVNAQRDHPGRLRGLDAAQAVALLEADVPVPPRSWRLTCTGLGEATGAEIETRLGAACDRCNAEFVVLAKAPTDGQRRTRRLSVMAEMRRERGAPQRDDFARWLAGCLTLDRCLTDRIILSKESNQ